MIAEHHGWARGTLVRYELTTDEIESYRDNGFVVIEDFLDAAELEDWRAVVGTAVAERSGRNSPTRTSWSARTTGSTLTPRTTARSSISCSICGRRTPR